MKITYRHDGRQVSEERALNAWVNYDTANSGSDRRESIVVFDKARERDTDGAVARDYLIDASVEIFFHDTGSSYDA